MVDLGFVGPSRPANDYRFVEVTDGDTPKIEMPIRMVSIDTPESEFGGSPPTAQAALERTRRTFNLDMVALGWAATFIIYPSIPRSSDLTLLIDEAEAAWQQAARRLGTVRPGPAAGL